MSDLRGSPPARPDRWYGQFPENAENRGIIPRKVQRRVGSCFKSVNTSFSTHRASAAFFSFNLSLLFSTTLPNTLNACVSCRRAFKKDHTVFLFLLIWLLRGEKVEGRLLSPGQGIRIYYGAFQRAGGVRRVKLKNLSHGLYF